eukprot:scaffold170050_cov14-Prasinocladus_malaysianus.AAC.1
MPPESPLYRRGSVWVGSYTHTFRPGRQHEAVQTARDRPSARAAPTGTIRGCAKNAKSRVEAMMFYSATADSD